MVTPLDVLTQAPTVLLTTFRKSGLPVPTPVWVVRIGDELCVWTNPRTGKYKRIRNTPRVTVEPCTFRGKSLGAPVEAAGRLLRDDEVPLVYDAIKKKYGLVGRWSLTQARLGLKLRGLPPSTGVAVRLV